MAGKPQILWRFSVQERSTLKIIDMYVRSRTLADATEMMHKFEIKFLIRFQLVSSSPSKSVGFTGELDSNLKSKDFNFFEN